MPSSDQSEPLSARIAASDPQKQTQSPIFASLYPELRNLVFRHALTEYDDLTRPYSKHEYYYRPGMEFAGKIDTNLLLACRLIYLETHLAPVALNEHVFWMHRGPPGRLVSDHATYFGRMTPQQRAAVRRVRFFTQLYWLESRGPQVWPAGLIVPKLTITIRHSDWWYWENSEPLRIQDPQDGWGAWVGSVPGLQEVELELETIDVKREQLEERVRVALGWTFPLPESNGSLVHDGEALANSMWLGTSRMSPDQHHHNYMWGADTDDEEEEEEYPDDEYDDSEENSDEEGSEDVAVGSEELVVDADEETDAQGTDVPVQESEENQLSLVEDAQAEMEGSGAGEWVEEASSSPQVEPVVALKELDPEARLDLRYPLDLKLHVRKFMFIHESRLV
ncbi:hypothetical protein FB451DRAFT_1232638 [Mycena latifolia]|nr:hypothetical protein FB451DRAFT_1232638 [Mycena latifolia]